MTMPKPKSDLKRDPFAKIEDLPPRRVVEELRASARAFREDLARIDELVKAYDTVRAAKTELRRRSTTAAAGA